MQRSKMSYEHILYRRGPIILHSVCKHQEYHQVRCVKASFFFKRREAAKMGRASATILCGTDKATVIPFYNGQKNIIKDRWGACSGSKAGAIEKMTPVKKWYNIVNGRYRSEAIIALLETNEIWAGSCCIDTLVQPGLAVKNTDSLPECRTPDIYSASTSGSLLMTHCPI